MIMPGETRTPTAPRRLLEGRRPSERRRRINVAEGERALSCLAGTLLTAAGLSRRGAGSLVTVALGGAMLYRGVTGVCPAYRTFGIDTASRQRGGHVAQSFTIDRPAEQLYRFWHDLTNLPRFMSHLRSVEPSGDGRSHWVADAPAIVGGKVEWDAEITQDVPNEHIAWRSLADADVDHSGSIHFESSPRGTVVHVDMCYVPPAARFGGWVAKLFGQNPEQQIREDLRAFKCLMETGEIPTTEGQPRGTCTTLGKRLFG